MTGRAEHHNQQLAVHQRAGLIALWALVRRRRRRQARQQANPPAQPAAPPGPGGPQQPGRQRRRPPIPRVRLSPIGLTSQQILQTYRMDIHTIMDILQEIEDDITPHINIRTAIPPLLKLMAVMQFCATGSYQHTVGMLHGISQPAFCKVLEQVTNAMLRRVHTHIYMPRDQAEINEVKAGFYAIAHFPHIHGCVDGTHIPIVPPRMEEAAFRNRKMQHTINVQMVCDHNLCIQHVCARYPGSSHDASVLRASSLHNYMEQRAGQHMWLLGE